MLAPWTAVPNVAVVSTDARAMCCNVVLRACAPCRCNARLRLAFAAGMRAARVRLVVARPAE
eukprot:8417828-Pyramimonas_sp.AAC.1